MSPEAKLLYYKSIIEDQRKQIERMKRAGRRKREECRKLKKQASLMQFVSERKGCRPMEQENQ